MADVCEPIKLLQKRLKDKPLVETEKLPKEPTSKTGSPTEQGFRVGALNIGSIIDLQRWKDGVKPLVEDNKFDIFAVIEPQLLKEHHTGTELDLPGYSYVRKDRRYAKKQKGSIRKLHTTNMPAELNSNKGGGILIHISNTVRYKVKSRGEYAESNVEFLHIEITSPVKLHLVALYCPNKKFAGDLISLMSYFMDPLGDRNIMFIGDTNINRYSNGADDRLGNTFFDVLNVEYAVRQLIDQKTYGEACIDHIFTNMAYLEKGVMNRGGHKPIYCTLKSTTQNEPLNHPVVNDTTTYVTYNHVRFVISFMENLAGLLKTDNCILAIFLKSSQDQDVSDIIRTRVWSVLESHMDGEVAFYKTIDNTATQSEIRLCIYELQQISGEFNMPCHKQCIIFTRNNQSHVFHALQKKMWYKDWDFVWQPRHVEFLGHVLEPSLTSLYPRADIWDPSVTPVDSIKLQESTYRYVANECVLMERLQIE